jgi:hypothetical protein
LLFTWRTQSGGARQRSTGRHYGDLQRMNFHVLTYASG